MTEIFSLEAAREMLPDLLSGLKITVQVTLLAFLISLLLGLVIAVLRFTKIPVLTQILSFLVLFIRGTPLLVQAYFAFNVIPVLTGVSLSPFMTGMLVLGVNYCAYTAEVYRSGIEGVPQGQWEAATSLSLPRLATWGRIILPQSVRTVLPVLGNYLIQMFKDSAILSAITVAEMITEANGHLDRPMEAYTLVGILFFAVSYPCSLLFRFLERRYAPNI